MNKSPFFILSLLLFFYSCSSDDEVEILPKIKNETLVDFSVVKKISSAEISAVYAALTIGLPTDKIPPLTFSSVSVYKLTYKTSYPGETNKVLASGALVVPDQTNSKPILSYQHGTITDPNQIPSLFASTSQNGYSAVLGGLWFLSLK